MLCEAQLANDGKARFHASEASADLSPSFWGKRYERVCHGTCVTYGNWSSHISMFVQPRLQGSMRDGMIAAGAGYLVLCYLILSYVRRRDVTWSSIAACCRDVDRCDVRFG